MTDQQQLDIALLKQSVENIDTQIRRLVSHVESEQRVYGGTSKRVDMVEKMLDSQQKIIDKLDGIVRNGGAGLQLRVDRIEQREKDNRNRSERWISIAAVVISLIGLAMQIINKT